MILLRQINKKLDLNWVIILTLVKYTLIARLKRWGVTQMVGKMQPHPEISGRGPKNNVF